MLVGFSPRVRPRFHPGGTRSGLPDKDARCRTAQTGKYSSARTATLFSRGRSDVAVERILSPSIRRGFPEPQRRLFAPRPRAVGPARDCSPGTWLGSRSGTDVLHALGPGHGLEKWRRGRPSDGGRGGRRAGSSPVLRPPGGCLEESRGPSCRGICPAAGCRAGQAARVCPKGFPLLRRRHGHGARLPLGEPLTAQLRRRFQRRPLNLGGIPASATPIRPSCTKSFTPFSNRTAPRSTRPPAACRAWTA